MNARHLLALALAAAPATVSAHALDHLRTKNDIGPNKVPHLGTSHILVVPTRVGVDEFPADRWEELERFFDPAGGPDTFRGYWLAVSGGRYDPIPMLARPVLYPDHCPLANKTVDDCEFDFTDLRGFSQRDLVALYRELLERVRDEQGVDLAHFDVNTAEGPGQDGWFDGVIVDSDIVDGVGIPLNAFGASVSVETTPGASRPAPPPPPMPDAAVADAAVADAAPDAALSDAGAVDAAVADAAPPVDGAPPIAAGTLRMGNVAMAPPNLHEFGHILGFIDLYNGPVVNDLMGPYIDEVTLSAFSRLQIEWGEAIDVQGPGTWDLAPTMEGGSILRIGAAPRYLLIEHRGGGQHAQWDRSPAGVYVYSVDEDTLPIRALGFLDLAAGDLYFPNADAPYLNVNLPLGCDLFSLSPGRGCAAQVPDEERALVHASGQSWGLHLRVDGLQFDGKMRVSIVEGELAPPPVPDGGPPVVRPPTRENDPEDAGVADAAPTGEDGGGGGCELAPGAGAPWLALLLALPLRRRRR